jgi:hypothetical protein
MSIAPIRRLGAVAAALCAYVLLFAVQAPGASAEVKWGSELWWTPVHLQEGKRAQFWINPTNVGDTAGVQPTITIDLPPGVTLDGKFNGGFPSFWSCSGTGTETITCQPVPPVQGVAAFAKVHPQDSAGQYLTFTVDVAPGTAGMHEVTHTISGGGAPVPSVNTDPIRISDNPLVFGLDPDTVEAAAYDTAGDEYTQAGGHPNTAAASLRFATDIRGTSEGFGFGSFTWPENHALADLVTTLPPGFVGDPTAVAQCMEADFRQFACPPESQVGVLRLNVPPLPNSQAVGVFNMVPPPGNPARFAFQLPFAGAPIVVDASVRADGDYGITMTVAQFTEAVAVVRSELIVWGNPAHPSHDAQRCEKLHSNALVCNARRANDGSEVLNPLERPQYLPHSSSLPQRALLSMPTNCADTPSTSFLLSTYQDRPADLANIDDPKWHRFKVTHSKASNCPAVPFDPTIDFEPGEKAADTPTGLDVNLHFPRSDDRNNNGVPDDSDPNGLIQAHLKKTEVTLPEGFAFNASAGDGLAGCTPEQIGLRSAPGETPIRFDNEEPNCPTAAKVANAVVTTPVLPDKLKGEVFLASQDDNPFDSTFAIYITVREPSILVKLPGLVQLDPRTGQITTTFDDNPQLPFSDLDLDFFGGPRASLATPKTCGIFNTRTELVPWSAADPDNPSPSEIEVSNDPFTISQGAGGQGCASSLAQLPLDVGFTAGSQNPLAGQPTAYNMRITRPDGHQDLDRLELGMPSGFTASLKGIPYCAEAAIASISSRSGRAEESSPACPAGSQIGTTVAGAGAGSLPLYRPGKLYLAGPYKSAPLSVVAVTPAVAGPFDLGSVVVRSQLRIDATTAQVTAITDPLPQTLEGVPLRIRDIRIAIDRQGFALNPTDCSELASEVRAFGANGGADTTTARFQATGCRNLGFKPRMALRLIGPTKRAGHPRLRAVVRPRLGDANFARAAVTLPRSAFLDQAHIRTICTRVQWAEDNCPKAAIYGRATAFTPLLDQALKGPVYLRSSDNDLPDLVADLRGPAHQPIKVELVGRVDSIRGGIRNTFEAIPDAPVSRFVLEMQGGKKGLIVNSRNLCTRPSRATARLLGQNSRRHNFRPRVVATKCKQGKKRKRSAKHRHAGGRDARR